MSKKRRTNPRRIPALAAEAERSIREMSRLSLVAAYAIFLSVLRDKEGYGRRRLQRVWEEIQSLTASIDSGYVSVRDLLQTLEEEAGIRLNGG